MNDEFLKKHNVRPDAEFVEQLYQDLEKSEQRTLSRFFRPDKFNLWLKSATVMALLLIGFIVFTTVTNTNILDVVQSWRNPEIAELVSVSDTNEGIEPAVVKIKTEVSETLPISSQTGDSQGEFEFLPYDQIPTRYPEFTIPTDVPLGYELIPEGAQLHEDGDIALVWFKGHENFLSYTYGQAVAFNDQIPDDHAPYLENVPATNTQKSTIALFSLLNGHYHNVASDDLLLTEDTLLQLIPAEVLAAPPYEKINFSSDPPQILENVHVDSTVGSSQELPQHRIDGLVNEPQKFNNQGPATLAIMLNYYGDDTTQNEAAGYLKPSPQDRNVSPWQISEYVNTFTQLHSITRSNGSQELLRELIANDFPVVIEKGYDAKLVDASGWYGHYLILYGYDDGVQEYNTIDTFLGPFTTSDLRQSGGGAETLADGYLYSYDHIDTYWQQFNRTFYLVYDPAREEELFAILGDQGAQSADSWLAAIEQAQSDIQTDIANPFAWFNLGTSLTELGKITNEPAHFENAAEAFDRAFDIGLPDRMLWYQHGPFEAYLEVSRYQDVLDLADEVFKESGGRTIEEIWLHQGHAQAQLQDFEKALASYNQAVKLNENFFPAQLSRDQLESMLNSDS